MKSNKKGHPKHGRCSFSWWLTFLQENYQLNLKNGKEKDNRTCFNSSYPTLIYEPFIQWGGDMMKRKAKTKQQLLLEIEEIQMSLEATQRRLQEANEIFRSDTIERKSAEETFLQDKKYAESFMETISQPLVLLSSDLKVICANRFFYESFQLTPKETEGEYYFDIGNHQWDIPALRELLNKIILHNAYFYDFEVDHEFPLFGQRTILLNARRIYRGNQFGDMILLALEDITELIDIGEEIFSRKRMATAALMSDRPKLEMDLPSLG